MIPKSGYRFSGKIMRKKGAHPEEETHHDEGHQGP